MPIKTFKWPGIQIPIDLNQLAIAQLFNSLSLGNKSSQNSVTVLITTASDFSYDDFIEVLMAFQKEWDIPVLTHAFPKKKLFNLRQEYGARIIRDDIVRKE